MMRFSKLVTVLICAAAVSACTTGGEKGNPTAAPTTGSSGNGSADGLPTRPSSLKVDSVDACKLLTTEHMKQIGVDAATPRQMDLVIGQKSPGCRYSAHPGSTVQKSIAGRRLRKYIITLVDPFLCYQPWPASFLR